jgi:hypothetical protein
MKNPRTAGAVLGVFAAISIGGCTTERSGFATAAGQRGNSTIDGGRCSRSGPLLPVTRLCQEQAAALLVAASGPEAESADGCVWVVNEARILDGGALLYRALRCNGRTAQLEFVAGARAASFDLVKSPWGQQEQPHTVAIMFDAEGQDAKAVILAVARRAIEDPAESARCRVRRLDGDVAAPADALVVDEVPIPPEDGVRSACGEFGFDGGAQTFWRVSQNTAWFFSLGNDTAPVDAESFTLVRRDAAGRWVRS